MQTSMSVRRGQRGFALVTAGGCAIVVVAMLGLAVDLGRIYIAKNEAQAYADSAALDGVRDLDGTSDGLQRARDAVSGSSNRAQLGSVQFSGTSVEFSTAATGPWETNPASATNYIYLRVSANTPVRSYFMPIVGAADSSQVRASAVAGQIQKTDYKEGSFPFSPLAHSTEEPDFGLTRGQKYTLRWAANPKVNVNTCAGDNDDTWIDQAEAGGGSERGYIEETSSALIREAIESDYMSTPLEVGDSVNMTGGAKQTQKDSIQTRVAQDTNPTAATYQDYINSGTGNGRRLIVVPINTYHPNYTILGFRAFFLLPASEYVSSGNSAFCAEYVGSYVQGAKNRGGGLSGAFVPRLVQ